jgi:hypothetical protein
MRFPNESDEYRAARDALLQEEIELRRRTEAVRSGGACRSAAKCRPTRLRGRSAARSSGAVRARQGHVVPLQPHVHPERACRSGTARPAHRSSTHLTAGAPHRAAGQLAVVAEAPLEQFPEHARTRVGATCGCSPRRYDVQRRLSRRVGPRQNPVRRCSSAAMARSTTSGAASLCADRGIRSVVTTASGRCGRALPGRGTHWFRLAYH